MGPSVLVLAFACSGASQSKGNQASGALGSAPGQEGTTSITDAGPQGPDAQPAPLTFVFRNTHTEDLVFNMDAGWAANIIMFSGQPPKAVSVLPFARHCTASCEAADEDRCPLCEEPEDLKEIRAAQRFETVVPGASIHVPWDTRVHVYKKTRGLQQGHKKRCKCYTTEPIPENTYTVRACGLRLTKTAKERSKIQCVDRQITFPGDPFQVVELEFGAPK